MNNFKMKINSILISRMSNALLTDSIWIYILRCWRDSACLFLRNKQKSFLLYAKNLYKIKSRYVYKLSVFIDYACNIYMHA